MKRLSLLLLLFGVVSSSLLAQQLPLFTQYRDHATIFNPAAVESDFLAFDQNITFAASYRSQWVGLENGPTTAILRGSYLNTEWNGVTLMTGGHIINDQTGPTGFTGIGAKIAGIVSGDVRYGGFGVGVSAAAVQFRVNSSEITLRQQGDIIGETDRAQWYPDLGAGVFFYKMMDGNFLPDSYLYGGVSIPQMFGLDLTFSDDSGEYTIKRVQHYYGNIGFYKFFNSSYGESFLEPSIWFKYTEGAPINVDFNLRYHTPASFYIGAGGSTAGGFHGEAGVTLGSNGYFDNIVRVGYGFGYNFSDFGPAAGTTHELNLAISFER